MTQGAAGARDFLALGAALREVPGIVERLRASGEPALAAFADGIDPCADALGLIESGVEEDGEAGASVRPGFWPALDAAVAGARETRLWLAGLERGERERTGIRSLKVGYNKVFGYYIEVTRPNLRLVPADYVRKQTVANGERYVTAPLKEAEARILAADEEIALLERAALGRLAEGVTAAAGRLVGTANRLAFLDALLALAEVAARGDWVRPVLEEGEGLEIVGGRHPVVEASLAGEAFIPNDCRLGGPAPRALIVTGPNMGGKSTFLRQVAVITLLAQVGSFVPARAARIGLVDRIFTRVGAQDDLARGASTFMVEMVETAAILHQATRKSLVVLDEVGRGTSTDDGLAIARAVLEDLHGRIGARTLFATHYLELTELADGLPGLGNLHVAALESSGRVIFLYAVRPGPADRAYGVQVGRLAGLPPWVADRAEALLADLGAQRLGGGASPAGKSGPLMDGTRVADGAGPVYGTGDARQLALDGFRAGPSAAEQLARTLRALDLEGLTPREAMDWLFEQQGRLSGGA